MLNHWFKDHLLNPGLQVDNFHGISCIIIGFKILNFWGFFHPGIQVGAFPGMSLFLGSWYIMLIRFFFKVWSLGFIFYDLQTLYFSFSFVWSRESRESLIQSESQQKKAAWLFHLARLFWHQIFLVHTKPKSHWIMWMHKTTKSSSNCYLLYRKEWHLNRIFFQSDLSTKKPMDHPSHSSVWLALNHSHHIVHSAKWLVLNQSHHFTSRHRHIILEKVQWLTWDDTPFVPALETKFSCTWYHSCFTLIQIKFKLNDFCKTPIGTKFRGRTSCNVNSIESKQQISISQLDDVFSVLLWLQVCHTPNLLQSSAGFKFLQRN